jgi:hypothetical protein
MVLLAAPRSFVADLLSVVYPNWANFSFGVAEYYSGIVWSLLIGGIVWSLLIGGKLVG